MKVTEVRELEKQHVLKTARKTKTDMIKQIQRDLTPLFLLT